MKKTYLFALIIMGCFTFQTLQAQKANLPQRGQRGYVPQSRFEPNTFIELVDPNEEVSRMLPKCIEEFTLDDFEKEILKSMLISKFESQNTILEDESNTRDSRKKKMFDLNNNFHKELTSILTQEEVDRFKLMDFTESKEEKKKKKKEKRKRKKGKS